jgi:hypothetical protein
MKSINVTQLFLAHDSRIRTPVHPVWIYEVSQQTGFVAAWVSLL